MTTSSKLDAQWQAEADARTLANYQEILNDKVRLRRATVQAKKEAANLTKRANAMSSAARTRKK